MNNSKIFIFFLGITSLLFYGCNSKVIFSNDNDLTFDKSTVTVKDNISDLRYIFRDKNEELLNTSDCSYDIHIISRQTFDKNYVGFRFINDCMKMLPFKDKIVFCIVADQYIVFSCGDYDATWKPDYEIKCIDGTTITMEQDLFPFKQGLTSGRIWRNILLSKKDKRMVCVDRMILKGKRIGIMYILQSKNKKYPFCSMAQWTVSDIRNLQMAASCLERFKKISLRIYTTNEK